MPKKKSPKPRSTDGARPFAPEPATHVHPPADERPQKTLMDTLEADTTIPQLIGIIGGMLLFPVVFSLLAKYVILPLIPGW